MKRKRSTQLELFADVAPRVVTPLARATARRGRHVEAPAPKPWRAVVLAVDTARRSGWALYAVGVLEASGEVDTYNGPIVDVLVANAIERAAELAVPCVLVLEKPWGGSVDVIAALGAARERWTRVWRARGEAPGRVVYVVPATWRVAVLGASSLGVAREVVRAREQATARAMVGREVGPDEAPAILIGRWAAHSARVGRAIGKRAAKASLRAWTTRVT